MAKKGKTVNLRLVIDVSYKPNGVTTRDLRYMLDRAAFRLAEEGNFTGETAAEVETWNSVVSGK